MCFCNTNKTVWVHTKSKMPDAKGFLVCPRTNTITHTHTRTSSEVLTAGCCHVFCLFPSRVQRELVLFDGFFYPSTQTRFVKGFDERLLRCVVLHGRLFGFVVWAGLGHFDAKGRRELRRDETIITLSGNHIQRKKWTLLDLHKNAPNPFKTIKINQPNHLRLFHTVLFLSGADGRQGDISLDAGKYWESSI